MMAYLKRKNLDEFRYVATELGLLKEASHIK
jgi:hypothetical protein